jgi:hypothetical protein
MKNTNLFSSGSEILLAISEEVGEIATEIALIDRVGTKNDWHKKPSKDRLSEEISQLSNLLMLLREFYELD